MPSIKKKHNGKRSFQTAVTEVLVKIPVSLAPTGVTLTPLGVTIVGVTTLMPEDGVLVALAGVPGIF